MKKKAPEQTSGEGVARPGTQRESAKLEEKARGQARSAIPKTTGKLRVKILDDATKPRAEGRTASRVVDFYPPPTAAKPGDKSRK